MKNLPKFRILLVLLIAFMISSCGKDEQIEILPTDKLYVIKDASYGNDPLQKMDIYLPIGRSQATTKTIVFIHGGGWDGGDKADLSLTSESLEKLMEEFPGFALINLNYRLVKNNENQYPAAENDIKQAMDYYYANLESYQVSTAIYMTGFSAGAHLAALHTLKHNNNNYIKGCIAVSGAYDFTADLKNENPDTKIFVEKFLGGTYTQKPDDYKEASPIFYIQQNSPKFFVVHGENDPLISVNQAKSFVVALKQKNVPTTTLYHKDGHGISVETLNVFLPQLKLFIQK